MTLAHIIGGPLDAAIEFGLPLVVFVVLWWWSTRGDKKTSKKPGVTEKDR